MSTDPTSPEAGQTADLTAPGTEPKQSAAPETQDAKPTPDVPGQAPSPDDLQQDPRWLTKLVGDAFGLKDLDRFRSDADLLKTFVHAYRKVGERDDDAQVGKTMRGREDELAEFLATKASPIRSYDEYARLLAEASQPGASPDLKRKVTEGYESMNRTAWELSQDPKAFIAQYVEDVLKEKGLAPEELEGRFRQQEQETEKRTFVTENASLIWNNGQPAQGLTAVGKRAQEIRDSDPTISPLLAEGRLSDFEAYRLSFARALAEHARSKPAQTAASRAQRQAPHAAPVADMEDLTKHLEGGGEVRDWLIRKLKAAEAE